MAFDDRELENLSAALVGLMRSNFELWSAAPASAHSDGLAIECTRARAEFEHALGTWVGVRASASRSAPALADGSDRAAETSVGDAPLVLPLAEARAIFEMLYVNGAVALFGDDLAHASKRLSVDMAAVRRCLDELRERRRESSELWSTVCALAQAGLEHDL